jgi:hypothetical protein
VVHALDVEKLGIPAEASPAYLGVQPLLARHWARARLVGLFEQHGGLTRFDVSVGAIAEARCRVRPGPLLREAPSRWVPLRPRLISKPTPKGSSAPGFGGTNVGQLSKGVTRSVISPCMLAYCGPPTLYFYLDAAPRVFVLSGEV